jgi:hypothetical protein
LGARRPSQLGETAQAADLELSKSDLRAIDETLATRNNNLLLSIRDSLGGADPARGSAWSGLSIE